LAAIRNITDGVHPRLVNITVMLRRTMNTIDLS
jgi:hypothetical protein